jgi:hypothetical protein
VHNLVQEFDGFVREKRFLIVLTDLCTIEEWDQIEKCLPNNKKGIRIIVSTTQVEVASLCAGEDSQASELKQLSADHTLYAFYDKVIHIFLFLEAFYDIIILVLIGISRIILFPIAFKQLPDKGMDKMH